MQQTTQHKKNWLHKEVDGWWMELETYNTQFGMSSLQQKFITSIKKGILIFNVYPVSSTLI
jgi:hypothetical protein